MAQMRVARENYQKLIYASGTSAAKDSRISVWAELCKRRNLPDMPLSPLSIQEVGIQVCMLLSLRREA